MAKLIDPASTGKFNSKEEALEKSRFNLKKMYDLLYLMFADGKHSLLIILQGIDTSGKDGAVRHIFQGANPQGISVISFKQPSVEDVRHDFLWRCHKQTPASGLTAIFNRSYYEEVTTVMVHPEFLEAQFIAQKTYSDPDFFENRYGHINDFEKMLTQKGTVVLKFLLHISKDEQKARLKERLTDKSKNWKFSEADVKERQHWDEYMSAFAKMIHATDTKHSPWHVVPADHKWYRDYLISKTIVDALSDLKMSFPKSKVKPSSIR